MAFTALDSVDARAHAALVVLVQNLALPNIGANVYKQMVSDQRTINLPCVLITKEDQAEEELETSTLIDEDFSLPYNLYLVDRQPPEDHTRLPVYQGWRQAVAHDFRTRSYIGTLTANSVPEVWDAEVKLLKAIDPAIIRQAEGFWLVSGMTITLKATLLRQFEYVKPY